MLVLVARDEKQPFMALYSELFPVEKAKAISMPIKAITAPYSVMPCPDSF